VKRDKEGGDVIALTPYAQKCHGMLFSINVQSFSGILWSDDILMIFPGYDDLWML
jgi:hypothetical protein